MVDATLLQAAERARLIDAYRAAYERANGTPAPRVTFRRGWYTLHNGGLKNKGRAGDLIEWTARLNARVPS